MTNRILVTGAAGAVGYALCNALLERGLRVRALVRATNQRSEELAARGAEIAVGDLLDLAAVHRAVEGCDRIYFGMSVSPSYLEAAVNMAAVAKHHKVEAFVNISQMTVSQMSITSTTDSPQQKLHWLAEQALNWSGLPIVHIRPTAFLDTFFFACRCSPFASISKSVCHLVTARSHRLQAKTSRGSSQRYCRSLLIISERFTN